MIRGGAMPRIRHTNPRLLILAAVLAMVGSSGLAEKNSTEPQVHAASFGHAITLHYVEEGTGVPVIFVHGSLSDGERWRLLGRSDRAVCQAVSRDRLQPTGQLSQCEFGTARLLSRGGF